MILVDTSGLLAAVDSAQRHHSEAARSLAAATAPLLLSPFVLAELDYLLATRVGELARSSLLAEVARGAYELQPFWAGDVQQARTIIERHAHLGVSLADASIVVLAARHKIQDVLTLDERHFRVLNANRRPFRLLPADA
ncbi:MAG: PIN domain-containing protein [Actinomycetota bacterium]|nr:PIN domain-containing protein [Actinomycetota bacterium]